MIRPGTTPAPDACLAIAAALLARASNSTWTDARTNPDPQLRFRGLGLDLAAAQALALLPAGSAPDIADPVQTDPLHLLRSAEDVLRRRPIEELPPGTSQLVVAVCDLIKDYAP